MDIGIKRKPAWIKGGSIEDIIREATILGQKLQADEITYEEFIGNKKVLIRELKKRYKEIKFE